MKRKDMQGTIKGANLFKQIELTFAETITGVQKIIGYTRMQKCETCDGKKVKVIDEQVPC